jgi:hypothetical protein
MSQPGNKEEKNAAEFPEGIGLQVSCVDCSRMLRISQLISLGSCAC